jgi:endonuclease G
MITNRPQGLKSYVELIARKHGGLEGMMSVVKQSREAKSELLESAAGDATAASATTALQALERGRDPAAHDVEALEAIIDEDLRPVIDVVSGKFESTHFLWKQLNTDDAIRGRLEAAMPAIGRIELPGHPRLPYGGTGFVVGDGLVMTNRHVAQIFANGLGTRTLDFKPGLRAGIDFIREQGRPPGQVFAVKRIVMLHPYWDMAILAVDGLGANSGLRLSLEDGRDLVGHDIAIVGYPAFDPRNPADVQQNLFAGRYGIKRLQPGELQGGFKTASFQKLVSAATHDCSTLGGNSGSALIDLSTGCVLALHFGGEYHARNYAVPTFELARDQRVVDAGVRFAEEPTPDATDWAEWWRRADEQESVPAERDDAATMKFPQAATASARDGVLDVEIPIHIRISVGGAHLAVSAAKEAVEGAGLEAMREPEHDTDYGSRRGYDPKFLDSVVEVPMPNAAEPAVLAKTKDGDDILHYQNFSLRMHAKRRLALVTASNVTKEPDLRKPEAGRDYTRKGLSGLGKNDTEKWFPDSRLDDRFQIPDVFFTKDRKAFDKGHIVRRDDVAWGETYEKLKRANGDSYHVTNCSPQVSGFNQFAKGDENWGDLENHVLSEAASERLCVFAGPVLAADDQLFHGVGDGRTKLLSRIPSRFWKVIVAQVEDGIAAYGFVQEQDLADVEFEFTVPEEFLPAMCSIADITEMTGVAFDQAILDADQFDSVRGVEIAQRSGTRRRRRRGTS